jgi:hypothetical protein
MNSEYPVVDSVELYRIGSTGENGFADVRQGDFPTTYVVGIAGQPHERVRPVRWLG